MGALARNTKIIENITISIVFQEVEGDGRPSPSPKTIENKLISIVVRGGGR